MSEKLEQVKNDYLTKLKKVKLAELGIDIDDVDNYVDYITADNEEEIEKQARLIVADVNRKPNYVDPKVDEKVWKPFNKGKELRA